MIEEIARVRVEVVEIDGPATGRDRDAQLVLLVALALERQKSEPLTSGLRVTGAYAHLFKADVTRDTVIAVGSGLINAAANNLNVFGVYAFRGPLAGLESGGGVSYAGETQASLPNTFTLRPTAELDVIVAYTLARKVRLQVNGKNLTDRHNYYTGGSNNNNKITVGTRRAVYVNLRVGM